MINEHDRVVLLSDLPHAGLTAGHEGTVVHLHDGNAAVVVEFMTVPGERWLSKPSRQVILGRLTRVAADSFSS